MTTTARACAQCSQAYPTRQALRRHLSMDHRPAADGAQLTARLVAAEPDRRPQAGLEPAAGVRHPSPDEPPQPRWSAAPLARPVLVALVLLTLLVGPVLVAVLCATALTVALWWRYDHCGRERRRPRRSA